MTATPRTAEPKPVSPRPATPAGRADAVMRECEEVLKKTPGVQ